MKPVRDDPHYSSESKTTFEFFGPRTDGPISNPFAPLDSARREALVGTDRFPLGRRITILALPGNCIHLSRLRGLISPIAREWVRTTRSPTPSGRENKRLRLLISVGGSGKRLDPKSKMKFAEDRFRDQGWGL